MEIGFSYLPEVSQAELQELRKRDLFDELLEFSSYIQSGRVHQAFITRDLFMRMLRENAMTKDAVPYPSFEATVVRSNMLPLRKSAGIFGGFLDAKVEEFESYKSSNSPKDVKEFTEGNIKDNVDGVITTLFLDWMNRSCSPLQKMKCFKCPTELGIVARCNLEKWKKQEFSKVVNDLILVRNSKDMEDLTRSHVKILDDLERRNKDGSMELLRSFTLPREDEDLAYDIAAEEELHKAEPVYVPTANPDNFGFTPISPPSTTPSNSISRAGAVTLALVVTAVVAAGIYIYNKVSRRDNPSSSIKRRSKAGLKRGDEHKKER